MEGKLLDLRGNEGWSRGVVGGRETEAGGGQCTSKRETGMTKDRDRVEDLFYFEIGGSEHERC
jgi:hypothetical protein